MTNEWMQDESLQNIDPYKLEFLQALVLKAVICVKSSSSHF